jgi:hypothetical protein
MASLLCSPHRFPDEALGALDAAIAMLNSSGANADIVIATGHLDTPARVDRRRRSEVWFL